MKTITTLMVCLMAAFTLAACTGDTVEPTASKNAYTPYPTPAPEGGVPPVDPGPTPENPDGGTPPVPPGGSMGDQFMMQQGTYCQDDGNGGCLLYQRPVGNYIALYDEQNDRTFMIDYAGVVARWYMQKTGRDLRGNPEVMIHEEPLGDGRVMTTITIRNGMVTSYVVPGRDITYTQPMIGIVPRMMIDPANDPAKGALEMRIELIAPRPGMAIPDLLQLLRAPIPGYEIVNIMITYSGQGMYHSESRPVSFAAKAYGKVMPYYPGMEKAMPPVITGVSEIY